MRKKSSSRTKIKKVQKKKATFFWQRGGVAQMVLLVIVLAGAFYMVGGFFPSNFLSNSQAPFDGVPDENAINESSENSLQLGTFPFKKCSSIITMDLMLDLSDSMNGLSSGFVPKIDRLKQAVLALTDKLSDESIIGVQTFYSIETSEGLKSILNDPIPISYYKEVKENLAGIITGLKAEGATPTHDALAYSRDKLKEAQLKYPDRQFNFIFISDGAPCPGFGCNAPGTSQDPRLYSPNPAEEIKAMGVNIYTVGIYAGGFLGIGGEKNAAKLKELLVDTASSPDNYFESKSGDDVSSLLSQISNKICEGEKKTHGEEEKEVDDENEKKDTKNSKGE